MADTRILEPVPAEDEIRIAATGRLGAAAAPGDWLDEIEGAGAGDWLEEVEGGEGHTLEWPAGRDPARERIDTPRVRHLFPVPEDADWEVRELEYDHYRRAG